MRAAASKLLSGRVKKPSHINIKSHYKKEVLNFRAKFFAPSSILTASKGLEFLTMNTEASQSKVHADHQWGKLSRSDKDEKFFAGPRGRFAELWSAFSIFIEFIKGFRALHFVGPCVTVFGSARYGEEHEYYRLGREVGAEIARRGFAVITGGGPGIMEAANRGAKDAGGWSIGSNIKLPSEEKANPYLDKWVEFDHFIVRESMLRKYSYGFIILPGGLGTMQEIFETWVLMQTNKMKDFPLVLMASDYWQPLMDFINAKLVASGAMSASDLNNVLLTDSPAEAVDFIYEFSAKEYGLIYKPKPLKILGEAA